MKIALLGYGKMGKMVEACALAQGHEIVARLSRQSPKEELIGKADICIDFSHPSAVLEHVQLCAKMNKDLLIGTTGWEEDRQQVERSIAQSAIGCLYAPNFSLGIYLFSEIVKYAAQLINNWPEYDVGAIEAHHRQKIDAPSGTAKKLTEHLLQAMPRLKNMTFSSLRYGSIPGIHTIEFDSPHDTITLSHQARNREGFAQGAIRAAEWLRGKQGFFTLDDMILFTDEPAYPLRQNITH